MVASVRFRLASLRDAGSVTALLTEAAEFARSREGFARWPIPFPPEDVTRSIAESATWLGELDGRVVVTFRLVWEDPLIWGEEQPPAGYVHKLAVRRADAHRGLGRAALEFAAGQVREAGRARVRLDCGADNPRVVALYRRAGFRPVRTILHGPATRERPYLLLERVLDAA